MIYKHEVRILYGWSFFFFIGCSASYNILLIMYQHALTIKRKIKRFIKKRNARFGVKGEKEIKEMIETVSLKN